MWTENEQHAFKTLKWRVSQAPVLVHADPDKQFRMETDASNYAYGAVLSQKQEDGRYHPIGFMLKSMNPAERNYGIPDKEALAMVKGLQNWRHYLERTLLLVQILTDHKNLEYFSKPRILNRRQMRWLELLTHYFYEIFYRPGSKNCAADALSQRAELRPPDGEDDQPQCLIPEAKFMELAALETEMTDSDWIELTDVILAALAFSDEAILSEVQAISQDWQDKPEGLEWDDGLGRKDGRIWIPEDDGLWNRVMRLYHDSPITGHLGTSGTLELVSRSYWRRNLPDWVKRYVQGCHTCRRVKHRNQRELGKLQPLPLPDGPWQWIQSDFVGELPKSRGFNAIYVVSNRLTKMAHFIPTTTDISAPDLMKLHIQHVWKLHGIPLVHGTDRGSTFTASFTKGIYKDLGIEPHFSTAYHPQTQGQVENNNKWMETYLRMFCSHRQDDWADLLPMAEFAYNNHHHPSIDSTPFFANYGYHPTLTNVPNAAQSSDADERIQRIHETQEECKCAIERSQEVSKRVYDKWKGENPGFVVGSSIWLEATNLSTDEPSPKLACKRHGPFKIKEKLSDLTYRLELPSTWKIHDVFHVNVLSEAKPDTIPGRRKPKPPPVKVNDEEFWVMEKYVDTQWFHNRFQFKIWWEGFEEDDDTWEDADDIDSGDGPRVLEEGDDDFDMEEDFYGRHPDAPRRTDPLTARSRLVRHRRVHR